MNINDQFVQHRESFRDFIYYNCGYNKELADDLTQDLYIKVKEQVSKGNYYEQGKFKGWCLWMARNMILDYYKKENRSKTVVISDEKYNFIFTDCKEIEENREDEIINEERFNWLLRGVNRAVEQLHTGQRKVFLMRVVENKSLPELIDETGE